MKLHKGVDLLEFAKETAIKRESSRKIKEASMKNLYYRMKNFIVNETDKIKSAITDEMAKPKKERTNKIVFYTDNVLTVEDNKQVFETCFNDELDDPLIDMLRLRFPHPYYKIYRKTFYEEDYYMNDLPPRYVIFIKWNKKKLGFQI